MAGQSGNSIERKGFYVSRGPSIDNVSAPAVGIQPGPSSCRSILHVVHPHEPLLSISYKFFTASLAIHVLFYCER